MKPSRWWLVGWVLVLGLAACGRGGEPGQRSEGSQVSAQRLMGTLELQVGYDFSSKGVGTANGVLDADEPLIGEWPIRITPLNAMGSPSGEPMVVTSQEAKPLRLELLEGNYRVELARPDSLEGLEWKPISPPNPVIEVKHQLINRYTGMMLCMRSGQEVHVFDYARLCLPRFEKNDWFPSLPSTAGSVHCSIKVGDNAADMAIQPDGKVLLVWEFTSEWRVARYNPDCSLDTSFGTGGLVRVSVIASNGSQYIPFVIWYSQITVAPGGAISILGHGRTHDWNHPCQASVEDGACTVWAKLNPNGTLDASFGGWGVTQGQPGRVIISSNNRYFGGGYVYDHHAPKFIRDMVQRSDGKYLVAGYVYGYWNRLLIPFAADGTPLYRVFNQPLPSNPWEIQWPASGNPITTCFDYCYPTALVALPGDEIAFTGGMKVRNGPGRIYVIKVDSRLHVQWAHLRALARPAHPNSREERGMDVASQSNGELIVAGYASDGSGKSSFLLRYFSNGQEDLAFGYGYVPSHSPNFIVGQEGEYNEVEVQSDDKILTAGLLPNKTVVLQRFHAQGQPDTRFGVAGSVTGHYSWASRVRLGVAAQDKIVTYLESSQPSTHPSVLTIYNP